MGGRSTGPASRPVRRGAAARPAAARAAAARPAAARPAAGKSPSPSNAARSRPAASAAARSASSPPTTAKVVRRTPTGWGGRVGGAATNHLVRRGVVLASVVAFLAVLLGSSVAAWFHQRTQIAALRGQVSSQEADVAALRAERERWNDPAYVEQQARERLKFVRPGERSYTVLDPAPATPGTPSIAGPGATEKVAPRPWYDTVWESVRTADAPGARR